jgi:PAS domain S-box-containing protein
MTARRRPGPPSPAAGTEAPLARILLDGVEDAVLIMNAALDVVDLNPAMERLAGLPRAAVAGRPALPGLPFLAESGLARCLERARAGETAAATDVAWRVEGREVWIEARYLPWRDAHGRVAGVVGFHTDVTERRHRAGLVRAVEAIGQSLTSSLDLNEVLDTIVHKACEVMRADAALLVSWDGQAPEFRVMRAAGRLSDQYAAAGAIPVGGGPISRAILQSRPVTAANILSDPETWLTDERRRDIEREGFKAVAAAPLASKGRVHGALVVHYWTERAFGDEDRAAVKLLAEHAALAIDNARVYADATRGAERLRELAEVEQLVAESLDVGDVLRRIAQATARLVDAPVVHVWVADPAARALHRQAWSVSADVHGADIPVATELGEGLVGRVAEGRTPAFLADVAAEPSLDWARALGLTSVLVVPILAGDSMLGVLAVHAGPEAPWSEEDRTLVTSLAGRAAIAMRNARAYADAVGRAARLRDLVDVTQSISASLDTTDVMQRIAGAAGTLAPGAIASVHVHDAARGVLRFAARSSAELEALPDELPADAGLPGLAASSRAPLLVVDPARHPAAVERTWWRLRPGATYYGVPIVLGESLLGVLDYIAPDGVPDAEDQEALRLLAAQAAVAIHNAALYQTERAQAARSRAVATVNQRLSSALDLDELLRTISESAAELTGVRFASFWLADERRRQLSFRGGSDTAIAGDFPQRVVPFDSGAVGWIARHRAPLVIDDVFGDPRPLQHEWWARWGLRALAGWPVTTGQELLAILMLSHSEPIAPTQATRDIIDMFLGQASVAVQNARLYRDAERRRDVAEVLARLARELTGTLDVQRIAELVTRGVVDLLGVRGSAVYRLEADGTLRSLTSYGVAAAAVSGVVLQPGEGVAGRAVADRKVLVSPDILTDPAIQLSPAVRRRIEFHGVRAVVAVPLLTHERVIGALTLGDDTGREFSADELQALQAFADQAALAFENARLYASAQDSLARLRDTQVQLVQAAKMSALGQLVSGVAHELNNPLSVIIGYGQLLLARDVPEPMRRPVELMVSQGDRMAKIVRNLLYFARQRPPERVAVDLHQVLEQTLALRVNQLALSGIRIERDFAAELPPIAGDAQQLEQVFLNLVLNAEQAILDAKEGGQITLRTRCAPGAEMVEVQVIDDGPGIPPDALSRVFEPFFTTKSVGSGTGLGLSVSYGIVEEHGGKLSVQSDPGRTVFTLELPVAERREAAPAVALPPPLAGAGRRALVVEDEPAVVDLVVDLLRKTGWEVDVASGGREGLERVRATPYALIVSDMRMPDGGGADLYRAAVAHEAALGSRFVFITGDAANPERWAFLRETGVPVVEKPFPPALFLDAVRRVLTVGGEPAV